MHCTKVSGIVVSKVPCALGRRRKSRIADINASHHLDLRCHIMNKWHQNPTKCLQVSDFYEDEEVPVSLYNMRTHAILRLSFVSWCCLIRPDRANLAGIGIDY